MDVKTKFGVTIFSNGDMDILKESLQEDLWRDYQFFCKKADSHRHKQSPKASLLVRRYERTAIITLFTFFSTVLDSWRIRQGAASGVSLSTACQDLLEDCRKWSGKEEDFAHLLAIVNRYEENRQAVLENISEGTRCDIEKSMCAFLDYMEGQTDLRRFPEAASGTEGLMKHLMGSI